VVLADGRRVDGSEHGEYSKSARCSQGTVERGEGPKPPKWALASAAILSDAS
jgi:hypothetical protein